MLSVLIPTYNYNVGSLINEVHKQLTILDLPFEIICMEDGSNQEFVAMNNHIERLVNVRHVVSGINHGRLETRKLLREKATYPWLLFLDADTLPKTNRFITHYLQAIKESSEVIFGGFAYYDTPPKKKLLLRWCYGRKYEAIPASKRNKTPYKVVISANFLIKNSVFKKLDLKKHNGLYGYDSYFSAQLKAHQINVVHIDNEVIHLGIETSERYLEKKEQAAQTLLFLYRGKFIETHDNGLLKLFIQFKRFKINYLFSAFFRIFRFALRKNLTGNNPSVYILQIYRISYLCYLDLHDQD